MAIAHWLLYSIVSLMVQSFILCEKVKFCCLCLYAFVSFEMYVATLFKLECASCNGDRVRTN